MDTPIALSRSGRVLKKSAKLLEIESDNTPKSGRGSLTLPKTPVAAGSGKNVSLDLEPGVVQPVTPVVPPSAPTVTPPGLTMKIKLDSGSESKTASSPTKQTETTSKLVITPSKVAPKTLIIKMKNDITQAAPKREAPTTEFAKPQSNQMIVISNKKARIEPEPKVAAIAATPASSPLSHSPKEGTFRPTELFNKKKDQKSPAPKVESPETSTKPPAPVAVSADKNAKDRIQKSFASSASKISTIITKSLPNIPRSIQDVRRINQAARAQRQQQQLQQQQQQLMKAMASATAPNTNENRNADEFEDTEMKDEKKKKKASVSAYVLWCIENRSHVHSNYPELDFINLSKKMGEIWHTLPQTEKSTWFKKAHTMTKSGATGMEGSGDFKYDDQDLKPEMVSDRQTLPITTGMLAVSDEKRMTFLSDKEVVYEGEKHVIGTKMVDIQAYLSILGDSLMTISSYMQRGIRYNSAIQYSPDAAVSTLLDTALVAMGTMAALTTSLPGVVVDQKKIEKMLDNVTLMMPPSELE